MKVLTLDIETIPSEPFDEVMPDGKPKFPPLPLHQPVAICWLLADTVAGEFEMKIGDIHDGETERDVLGQLSQDLRTHDRLVTWNGRGFDMPLLNLRAMALGVDWSFWIDRRNRFPNFKTGMRGLFHYDLQDQLGDYGARGIGLDRTSKLVGLPGKIGVGGAGVADAIAAGERQSVIDYCCQDVFETFVVYLHFAKSHLGGPFRASADRSLDAVVAWSRTNENLKRLTDGQE